MTALLLVLAALVVVIFAAFLTVVKKDIDADFKSYDRDLMVKHLEDFNGR
jgi:hypothetical protein